jgi:hypothetical protein
MRSGACAEQESLDAIVARMAEADDGQGVRPRPLGKQAMSRGAGGGLRHGSAGTPDQNVVRRAEARAEGGDLARFVGSLRPQPMINGRDMKGAMRTGPVGSQHQQRG